MFAKFFLSIRKFHPSYLEISSSKNRILEEKNTFFPAMHVNLFTFLWLVESVTLINPKAQKIHFQIWKRRADATSDRECTQNLQKGVDFPRRGLNWKAPINLGEKRQYWPKVKPIRQRLLGRTCSTLFRLFLKYYLLTLLKILLPKFS